MNQADRELFFEESLFKSTLSTVEREKLILSPQGNHKRSFIGQKWFYFGETTENYSLFCDMFVEENDTAVFVRMFQDGELMTDTLVAIPKEELNTRYPVQALFPNAMEQWEAELILRNYFKEQ